MTETTDPQLFTMVTVVVSAQYSPLGPCLCQYATLYTSPPPPPKQSLMNKIVSLEMRITINIICTTDLTAEIDACVEKRQNWPHVPCTDPPLPLYLVRIKNHKQLSSTSIQGRSPKIFSLPGRETSS